MCGIDEAREVGGSVHLGRDDVRDGSEADVSRFWLGADEAQPFFCNDEGDEEVGGTAESNELAEVHHGVDMASAGVWYRHHMAADGGRRI